MALRSGNPWGLRIYPTWCLGAPPLRALSAPEPRGEGAGGCGQAWGRPRLARGRCPLETSDPAEQRPALERRWVRKGLSPVLPETLGCGANPPAGIPSTPQQRAAPPAGRGPSYPRFPEHSGLGIFIEEFLAEGFNSGTGLGFPE